MTPNINRILRSELARGWCGDPRRGAAMGDASRKAENAGKLYLQRVRFVDGDYAGDGTYWGGGSPLWCAFDGADSDATRIYVRGDNRVAAIQAVCEDFPDARFLRA
jgi:hypothetical protein